LTNALIKYNSQRGVNTPRESFEKLKEDGYGEEQLNTIKAMIRSGIIQADAGAPRSGKTAEENKEAGRKTETAGTLLNPLMWPVLPVAIALGYKKALTDTPEDVERLDAETWKNILIPGRGMYNRTRHLEGKARDRTIELIKNMAEREAKSLGRELTEKELEHIEQQADQEHRLFSKQFPHTLLPGVPTLLTMRTHAR
jgi:hypothetical protein